MELDLDGDDGPTGTCNCPYGREGNFCKHLVALGLSLMPERAGPSGPSDDERERARGLDDWLSGLTREDLLSLVRDEAATDARLRRRLELRAASDRGDLAGIKDRVLELLDMEGSLREGPQGGVDLHEGADRADEALAAIRGLLHAGRAADAAVVAREALELLAARVGSVGEDDSWLGMLCSGLVTVHHEACRAARPDPVDLARWLVTQAVGDTGGVIDADPLGHEDVLGERGMAAMRRFVREAWWANPTGLNEKYLMNRLARADRDIDTVIAVQAADLAPNGHTHLSIARELEDAGRHEEARAWAERGLRECEDLATVAEALVDHLADLHHIAGRYTEALALRRDHFTARPTLRSYRRLRDAARSADSGPAERHEALELLRADAARGSSRRGGARRATLLVDVLLDDKDTAAAWQAATRHGADDTQWLALADQTRPLRPAAALTVYLRLATPLTTETGNRAYTRLVDLLLSIRDCHQRLDTEVEFTAYVTTLRKTQKRKPNLMRLLDQNGL
ncbi:hypothetical protein AB0M23_12705 [Streptomyces sp. NPDC052077]|uniref:hypothetical protein n=1 Tax=Streptomyces sp. NPDC052077 TaxID=3154757 RepID=UPI003418FEFA